MKSLPKLVVFFFLMVFSLVVPGCTDKNGVIDENNEVPDHNWTYLNKFRYDVKINDENAIYKLYLNLRVTADYKYSNLFVLISEAGPRLKPTVKRFEFTLADKEGQWLGDGSGNLYSYQIPFITGYKFPAKGTYHFYIEQNMRDNPLREISDVGMRVEKAQ